MNKSGFAKRSRRGFSKDTWFKNKGFVAETGPLFNSHSRKNKSLNKIVVEVQQGQRPMMSNHTSVT